MPEFYRERRMGRTAFVTLTILTVAGCATSQKPMENGASANALTPPDLARSCTISTSRIDSLVVKKTGLAYSGAKFGDIGSYTYFLAEATGKVDVTDPCAATIVDLKAGGDDSATATYTFDVVILKPTDSAKVNGTLLYEVVNRGRTIALAALQDSDTMNIYDAVRPVMPTTGTSVVQGKGAGNAFLLNQGVTIVMSGWQGDRPQALKGADPDAISATNRAPFLGMTVPVANAKNGKERITGVVQDEFIADSDKANVLGTYYKRVPDTPATLTVRKTALSAPIEVSSKLWKYVPGAGTAEGGSTAATGYGYVEIDREKLRADPRYIAALDAGRDNGSIYHFNYTAMDPRVMGLGFLATRDLISFLRYEQVDAAGNKNPLNGQVKTTVATGISQSGRYLRDFLWQGFNADSKKRPVFDGVLPLVGGSRKTYTNYRWAKPGGYSRQHETHFTPGDQFPFAYETTTDPLTNKTDGILKKCSETHTCPKVIQYDSPIEANGARTSLLVTDGAGRSIATPDSVRLFYAPGTQHTPMSAFSAALAQPDYSVDRKVSATEPSANPGALVSSTALYRALFHNLVGWVQGTAKPLESRYPSVADGTLAKQTADPASVGAPDLSALGLGFSGGFNTLSVNDESVIPSVPSDKAYLILQPAVDTQGNERGGVKMPDVAVPLATFTNYNLRRSGYSQDQQNGLNSSQLAFALTAATKRPGDPRKSIQELYGSKAGYVSAVNAAIDTLVEEGFILKGIGGVDDAAVYKARALMQSQQPNFSLLRK